MPDPNLYLHPGELLQHLIRFDTTNPPGNEAECIAFIASLLRENGIEPQFFERTPGRPNLVARIKGGGNARPLLLHGHVDVVTTRGQDWKYPPFEALIAEGCIWGRGALDMKGYVAAMLVAFIRAKNSADSLPGDVIFAAHVDEEVDSDDGARFMVEHHAGLFKDVRYAISEAGGFTVYFAGQELYPIMIGEKQGCTVRLTFCGPGGHGSMPIHNGAMSKLARAIDLLNRKYLPVHVTDQARLMIQTISKNLPVTQGLVIRQLLNPALTNATLKLIGDNAHAIAPLLHNSISPTMVQASEKINVIPAQVTLDLDARLLPGFTLPDLESELHALLGDDLEIEVLRFDPFPNHLDMGLYDTLAGILQESIPGAKAFPMLMTGISDARFFARLGIQTYGFAPARLPREVNVTKLAHAANERIPVEALETGTQAIFNLLHKFN